MFGVWGAEGAAKPFQPIPAASDRNPASRPDETVERVFRNVPSGPEGETGTPVPEQRYAQVVHRLCITFGLEPLGSLDPREPRVDSEGGRPPPQRPSEPHNRINPTSQPACLRRRNTAPYAPRRPRPRADRHVMHRLGVRQGLVKVAPKR